MEILYFHLLLSAFSIRLSTSGMIPHYIYDTSRCTLVQGSYVNHSRTRTLSTLLHVPRSTENWRKILPRPPQPFHLFSPLPRRERARLAQSAVHFAQRDPRERADSSDRFCHCSFTFASLFLFPYSTPCAHNSAFYQ